MTDALFDELIADEIAIDRRLAKALVKAASGKDPETFLEAVDEMRFTVDGWRYAMLGIGRLLIVSDEIKAAFLPVWIENKGLAQAIGNRPTAAAGLRRLLPGVATSEPMTVFRGTSASERRRRLYGFSWTTDEAIARRFAELARRRPGGGVVLSTVVPAEAVLLVRGAEGYYDEAEVVVDPFKLGPVSLVERLPEIARTALL